MKISAYFESITKVLAIGAGFATLPLFVGFASLEPPFPPAASAVSAGLVMVGTLIIWEWTRRTAVRNRRRWILFSVGAAIVALLLYLILYSMFVEKISGTDIRVVRGFTCTPDALEVYGPACPDLPTSALEDAGYRTEDLWTRQSLTVARVGLASAWFVFTAGLIMTVGAVVAGRRF